LRRRWLKGLGPRGTGAFFEPVVVTEELRTVARLGSDYSNRTDPLFIQFDGWITWAAMIEGTSSALRVHHVDATMQSL
jgi:hypothetical protein